MNDFQNHAGNVFYSKLLRDNLKKIFGDFDEAILNEIENQMVWIELEGGKTIIKEGDVGDSLYFVLSGRLSATKKDEMGNEVKLGEVVRGEAVGEMAIFTGEPRYATITAIRDSVLVQLSKSLFEEVISKYPDVSLNVTRLIIDRFKNNNKIKNNNNTVNLCFVPVHDTIDFESLISTIYDYASISNKSFFIDHSVVKNNGFNIPDDGFNKEDTIENKKLIQWLNNQETQYEFMIFACDKWPTPWNKKCLRQADHIILLADATQSHEISKIEQEILKLTNVNISLVLNHPSETNIPNGTIHWLNARVGINNHFHLREGNTKDIHRLTRILTGRATGLVLAGGGAKGFAHIGAYKALEENEIAIDYIGGTSMGSMIGAAIALDISASRVEELIKNGTYFKPSSDISFFPFVSLVKGVNVKKMIVETYKSFCGRADLDLSDTWIPMYAVASNFTKSEQTTFFRGSLVKVLLASTAIPGIFPPVIMDGDLYVDGGAFNNFPVDIMRNLKMNKVIGVDFMLDRTRKLSMEDMPTNIEILKSKIFKNKNKKYKVPNIGSIIINSTLMYSNAKRHETKNLLDLHFNPDVSKFGLTAWTDFNKIVDKGFIHAREVLANISEEELNSYKNHT